MAFLAFDSANVLYANAIHSSRLEIVMELFVNAIKFISCAVSIVKIHLCLAMTVYAPAHAYFGKLFHLIHMGNRSVTGLTLYIACTDVLRMTEEDIIG